MWHLGPGEQQFTLVEEVLFETSYVKFGLPGGQHQYKVVGVNSRGEGPASDVVTGERRAGGGGRLTAE